MNVQDIRLDIDKKTGVAQWVTIGQGDKGGTTIRATVFDNDVAAVLTGMSARFEMRMPNATYFEDTNCTINGNVITYVVDESHAALYAGGESVAYFALYEGETAIYSTERFHVRVARAASDGANPGRAWTNGIEEWLDEASDTLDDAVADANSRVGATINAANAAVEGMRSDVDEAISDTEEVIGRAEDAIDAMGDISEQAVPEMSADVRGGAKLEAHGGLALRDGALGIGSLVQESDGYARGGLAEVTAKGHAEQFSTTGKNLLDIASIVRGRLNTEDGTVMNADKVTIDSRTNTSITFTTTATWKGVCTPLIQVVGGQNYSISLVGTVNFVGLFWYDSSEQFISYSYQQSGDSVTSPSNAAYVRVEFGENAVGTYTVSNPQLELGSTATEYEPYTGGAPSPSPDYPQEIQVVRGRNLWPYGSSWSKSGEGTAFGGSKSIDLPAGTYTITFNCPSTSASAMQVLVYDSNDTRIYIVTKNNPFVTNGKFLHTFTLTSDGAKLALYFNNSVVLDSFQLERGYVATPYVPYGHVGMEVRGRNWLDYDAWKTVDIAGGNGVWENNGVTVTATSVDCYTQPSIRIPVSTGDVVTISWDSDIVSGTGDVYIFGNGSTSSMAYQSASVGHVSYTVPSNITFFTYRVGVRGNGNSIKYKNVRITINDKVTDYEPYYHETCAIPLPQRGWVAGLSDGTADSLRLDGAGKCEWTLPTSEVVLDGSENWSLEVTNGFFIPKHDMKRLLDYRTSMYASHFIVSRTHAMRSVEVNGVSGYPAPTSVAPDSNWLYINKQDISTAADFKTWLQSNPVTVLYLLATPIVEDCGYVDMPEISGECQVSIPELDALGIKYFVDDTVTQYGREIYARVRSEYADRITALEQAVAELATS